MSLSLSSSLNPPYDVFINHRGEGKRHKFASHLYAALSNAGVVTFFDHDLSKGTKLAPVLSQAIEKSRIAVVVFSENYSQSLSCLSELEKIVDCKLMVMPVFYCVDPSDVRQQMGEFGKGLEQLAEKRFAGRRVVELLLKWGGAITQATRSSGWHIRDFREEPEIVKKIVDEVLRKLDNTFLPIAEFSVGLEPRVQEVIGFIKSQSSKVCAVGIWGMGGLGKTTLAKAIYNRIYRDFDDRSFIENIREVCEKDIQGLVHLQEQLLLDVLKATVKIHSVERGTAMIEKKLHGKRVLIVLDDVTLLEQLTALCGNRRWIDSGSVIIVTTRDVRLLNIIEVDKVFQLKEMDENESLELFSLHAFREPSIREDFRELSRTVVAYCGGLPLALEVVGSYLFQRGKHEWESVLSKLERIPNDLLQEKLKISYDGLDVMEKNIFLDICCFFIGMDRAYVTNILNGCGFYSEIGIKVLVEKSLIKIERNNKLGMHDLLRDMGREIVRQSSPEEPEKRSRLWNQEDVVEVLTEHTGTKAIEGMALNLERSSKVCFDTRAFMKMKRLRLLKFNHVKLAGDYEYLSKHLRWVYWKGFPLKYIPGNFDQKNLIAIDLRYSNIKLVWQEPQLMERLKFLNLSHSRNLIHTPNFSNLPNLEELILKDCPSLSEIHQSIGDLRNIILINLMDCTGLGNLPRSIYQLKSLRTLILSGCSKIDKLEEDIGQMESLTTLTANNTGLKEIPFSLVKLKNIEYISVCGYEGLTRDVFPSIIWSWMTPTMHLKS